MNCFRFVVVLALFILCCPQRVEAQTQPEDPLRLVRTFEAPAFTGRIGHLDFDTKRQRLLVAVTGSNTVEIIDVKTGKAAPPLTSLAAPHDVLYLGDSDVIAVSSSGHGKVFFYDGEKLELKSSATVKRNASNMRYDEHAKLLYVANGSGEISVIDPRTAEVVRSFDLGSTLGQFELEVGGNRLFANLSDKGEVAVLNRETGETLAKWPLGVDVNLNIAIAVDSKSEHLFVATRKPTRMIIMESSTGKAVATLGLINDCETIAFDPNTNRVYATCGMGTIDVFSKNAAGTFELEARIPTPTASRTSVFDPHSHTLYLISPGSRDRRTGTVTVYQSDAGKPQASSERAPQAPGQAR